MSDLRNDLAKARDAWLESPEGIRCQKPGAFGVYLRNRLESAFIAGWNAARQSEDRGGCSGEGQ